MKIRRKILLIVLVSFLVFSQSVKAEQFTHNNQSLSANSKISFAEAWGDTYKYVRVKVKAKSSSASYTVSLIGTESISKVNSVSALNTSPKKFSGTTQYIVYILPRSGMSCPSDASYCFGAGSDYSRTTVIQGNECNGKMCSLYGIRINNKKLFNTYNVDVNYEFVK